MGPHTPQMYTNAGHLFCVTKFTYIQVTLRCIVWLLSSGRFLLPHVYWCPDSAQSYYNSMIYSGGQKYDISVAASSTLRDLFEAVSRATDVEPKSLKIIHRGKSLSYDETSLADVRMLNGAKLMALGRKVCNTRIAP